MHPLLFILFSITEFTQLHQAGSSQHEKSRLNTHASVGIPYYHNPVKLPVLKAIDTLGIYSSDFLEHLP